MTGLEWFVKKMKKRGLFAIFVVGLCWALVSGFLFLILSGLNIQIPEFFEKSLETALFFPFVYLLFRFVEIMFSCTEWCLLGSAPMIFLLGAFLNGVLWASLYYFFFSRLFKTRSKK